MRHGRVTRARASARGILAASLITLSLTACASTPPATQEPATASASPTPSVPVEPAFDRSLFSLDDPNSIWVVSNKQRPLNPQNFAPGDLSLPVGVDNEFTQPLREPAARAVEQLVAAAAAEGITLRIISAYRDVGTQDSLYSRYVQRDGQAAADTYSARPGHSEHQTGLAVDFDDYGSCYLAACFAQTPAGIWLAEHASEFGFIIRYPSGSEAVTGFQFEPWHFRYVGQDLATEMTRTATKTLEEFFGLPPAPNY
jgi:D-alanyl-D-alanine carboxypeptidase